MGKREKLHLVNDPIYGFISISDPFVFKLIQEPIFQRLRRITQMGLSHLVYPGALHSRFNHVLGCMHLTGRILDTLEAKGVSIRREERRSSLLAALLHDIGHGPYSHALEGEWVPGLNHEELGLLILDRLNQRHGGALEEAILIFTGRHPRPFFNQLLSGHLDADRLDYLKRDSFYCGVPEGNLNTERLMRVFDVQNDQLVVLEKGIHSIEEFLMARRYMYWQVYLHKTSLVAELMLKHTLDRARRLICSGAESNDNGALSFFLSIPPGWDAQGRLDPEQIYNHFLDLDDSDVLMGLKRWRSSRDPQLSYFSRCLLERRLPHIRWIDRHDFDKGIDFEQLAPSPEILALTGASQKPEDLAPYYYQDRVRNSPYNLRIPELLVRRADGGLVRFTEISELFRQRETGEYSERYFRVTPREQWLDIGALKES